jgi:hypothetical protein
MIQTYILTPLTTVAHSGLSRRAAQRRAQSWQRDMRQHVGAELRFAHLQTPCGPRTTHSTTHYASGFRGFPSHQTKKAARRRTLACWRGTRAACGPSETIILGRCMSKDFGAVHRKPGYSLFTAAGPRREMRSEYRPLPAARLFTRFCCCRRRRRALLGRGGEEPGHDHHKDHGQPDRIGGNDGNHGGDSRSGLGHGQALVSLHLGVPSRRFGSSRRSCRHRATV